MFAVLNVVGGLGIFLLGMKMMSDGIHKTAGARFHRLLERVTGSPLAAIATGVVTTALVQSSSATTVMLVSLVNARLVGLAQAIGVVMGANIGTTLTAWIVSFFGFQVKITAFALPAIAISLPLHFSRRERTRDISGILLGFGLLFLGLYEMKEAVSGVRENAAALQFLSHLTGYGPLSTIMFILVGTLLTIAVQSSSAAMTITITLAYNGWIPFETAAAIVLGENIGTTITAYLASLEMNTNAKRAARAHMVFNLVGVTWMLFVFRPILNLVDLVVPGSALATDALPYHLSAFHTFFNLVNTAALVWFIPLIERLVVRFVPETDEQVDLTEYHVPVIRGAGSDQVEASLVNGRTEVGRMSRLVNEMMLDLMDGVTAEPGQLNEIERRLSDKEEFVDRMQDELSTFLAECSTKSLTEGQALEVRSLLRVVNELESISDACHKTATLYVRKRSKKLRFHENATDEISEFAMNVADFLKYNTDYLNNKLDDQEIEVAADMEHGINQRRNLLNKLSRKEMKRGGDVRAELLYMEIIRQMEHIGDFCLNIAQAVSVPTP